MDHELDTQNFEQFDEEGAPHTSAAAAAASTTSTTTSGGGGAAAAGGGKRVAAKADPNFIGYTYKNWEAVQPAGGERGGRKGREGVTSGRG